MLIGEAPGAEEDKAGIPFIGKAGKLLDSILLNLGFDVDSIYITNVIKCHPPYNSKPNLHTIDICASNYLTKEIEIVKPELIVVMGTLAAKEFMQDNNVLVAALRNNIHYTQGPLPEGYPFIVTYHPAATFHKPELLENIVDDFSWVRDILSGKYRRKKIKNKYRKIKSIHKIPGLSEAKWIDLDLETDGKDPFIDGKKILSLQLSIKKGSGYYLTWNSRIRNELAEFLSGFSGGLNGHNFKHDLKWLRVKADIWWTRKINDTIQNLHLVDENFPSKALDAVAPSFTEMKGHKDEFQKLVRKNVMQLKEKKERIREAYAKYYKQAFLAIPEKIRVDYGAGDADAAGRLRRHFRPLLKKEGVWELHKLIMDVEHMYVEMECNGMRIDVDSLPVYEEFYSKQINKLESRLEKYAGYELNPRSPKQLMQLIYGKFKCMPHEVRMGKKRVRYSTSEASLDLILQDDITPRVRKFIETLKKHRKSSKLYGTYVAGMPRFLRPGNLLHANWRLDGTKTGRTSCNEPNLQQIPKEGTIKELFISRYPKGVLLGFDVSQGELRIGAHMSEEKHLMRIFNEGKIDIHTATAAEALGIDPKDVTPDQRFNAKTVNFAILYGTGIKTLAQSMKGVTEKEATSFIRAWHKRFTGWKPYVDSVHQFVIEYGYVRNIFNRKYRIVVLEPQSTEGFAQLRQAVNYPIQGGLGDFNKLAGLCVYRKIKKIVPAALITGEVHDQYIYDFPNEKAALRCVPIIKEIYENVDTSRFGFKMKVPMKVDVKIGPNWRNMEEV